MSLNKKTFWFLQVEITVNYKMFSDDTSGAGAGEARKERNVKRKMKLNFVFIYRFVL